MAIFVAYWAHKKIAFKVQWNRISRILVAAILMGVSISWFPYVSWAYMVAGIVAGAVVYTLLLVMFRVISNDTLLKLKHNLL